MTERDYTNIINTYRVEGLEEGEAKGETRGKMEVARAMKAKGLGMALISELTGLSEEEIRQS